MPKRTKKKGGAANNAKVKEYYDKINNYIKHCTRLQLLYDKKHNEVRTLTNYLLEIDRDFPNVPVNHQIVGEIIRAIEDLPAIDSASQKLNDLDGIQNTLMVQALDNRKVIHQKINHLRISSGRSPGAPPVEFRVPVIPPAPVPAPVPSPSQAAVAVPAAPAPGLFGAVPVIPSPPPPVPAAPAPVPAPAPSKAAVAVPAPAPGLFGAVPAAPAPGLFGEIPIPPNEFGHHVKLPADIPL